MSAAGMDTAGTQDLLKHMFAGATSGCINAVVTCPLDVIKTRMQNQGMAVPKHLRYTGIWGK